MSFTSTVKNEVSKIEEQKVERIAELSAILRNSAVIGSEIKITTENASVARLIFNSIKELYSITPRITVRNGYNYNKNYIYILEINKRSVELSKDLSLDSLIPKEYLIDDDISRRAYLRGAFLGGGSVTSPKKSYHFEIETHYHGLSNDLVQLFEDEEINVKTVERKSGRVLYIKESETIADVIALMGATDSMIEVYNIKMEKDYKNNINRQVNCETANLKKIGDAAAKQIFAIKKLMADKTKSLPEQLIELAALRIEYPEASLKELGEMLTPPISKSGVNHRLNKLIEMAEKSE